MSILTIFAALVIGFAAGLRALTAPAVVAWSAYLGFLDLRSTPFGFVASPVSVTIFSVLAIGEYVGDLLPNAPNRTAPGGLIARILTGSFSAACLLSAIGLPWGMGFIGAIGAVAGTFGGDTPYETSKPKGFLFGNSRRPVSHRLGVSGDTDDSIAFQTRMTNRHFSRTTNRHQTRQRAKLMQPHIRQAHRSDSGRLDTRGINRS